MGFDCEDCCRSCCYSTPFFTFTAVSFTGIGLVGFTLSSLYGVAKMNTLLHIQNGTVVVMTPVVCGAFLLTFLPLVLISIMSYCITGYIRDILFQSWIKTCIRSLCYNITLLVMVLAYILMWVIISVGMGGVMAYHIQVALTCSHRNDEVMAGDADSSITCLPYVDSDFNYFPICNLDLDNICSDNIQGVGLAFSVSIIFAVAVVMGLVGLGLIQASNFISARDNIDYRENTRSEYDMKRVH